MSARRQVVEEKIEPQGEPIHIKYRPRALKDVLGQKAIVKSLEAALSARALQHCYLFTGPRGTGKTTLARIVGDRFGCHGATLIEVDAASNSGVDDARKLLEGSRYLGFGENPNKMYLIDECHRLSANAWDAFLKATEDCPSHIFFAFCSTSPEKIPPTIVSRCTVYNLSLLRHDDLLDLLEDVCEAEGYATGMPILNMISRACEGSARQALTMLAAVHASTPDEAEILLQAPLNNKEVIDLCRLMVKGDLSWGQLTSTLKSIKEIPAETIRILVVNYLNACLMPAKSERDIVRLLGMLECFLKPCNPQDKLAPILVAFGRYIYPD